MSSTGAGPELAGALRARRRPQNGPRALIQAVRRVNLARQPKLLTVLFLWLLGLLAMFLPAPQPIDAPALKRFEAKVNEAGAGDHAHSLAVQAWWQAQAELDEQQVWFWFLDGERRRAVAEKRKAERAARARVREHERRRERLLSDAKAALGLWSAAGVDEGRRLFWQSFEAGKVFGRRQTWWDMMWGLLSARDKSLPVILLELIATIMVNFTAGLSVSVFAFLFQVPRLIQSYQANFVNGALFFMMCAIASVSVVATFLVGLYAAGATAVYAAATLIASNRRLAPAGAPSPALRYHVD